MDGSSSRWKISPDELIGVAVSTAEFFCGTFLLAYFGYLASHPLAAQNVLDYLGAGLRPSLGFALMSFGGSAAAFLRKLLSNGSQA